MARKPLDRWWKIKDDGKKIIGRVMTVAENVLKYGTGGINIDESRVEGEINPKDYGRGGGFVFRGDSEDAPKPNTLGRFPANLIHDNSEEVRECFPETKSGAVKQFTNNGANQPINL
jgi:site-specific DNA-methyltransferase (adenine-specific)